MRQKNVLIVTSVASMVEQFLLPDIELLQKMGYGVDVATNLVRGSTCTKDVIKALRKTLAEMEVHCHQVDFERDIFQIIDNARAYRQLKKIIRQKNYAFIHCHSQSGRFPKGEERFLRKEDIFCPRRRNQYENVC